MKRIISVVDYDPLWPRVFDKEKTILAQICGSNAISIEHIGSTSVEGLAAKAIIDILIEVKSLNQLDCIDSDFQRAGYVVKGENEIDGRRYFQKGGPKRSHHVHAFKTNDAQLLRHRSFKAYLLAHKGIADDYGYLKKEAAQRSLNDAQAYMLHKHDFIEHHQQLALRWYSTL